MEASGEKLASGSINTEEIRNTHQKIKEIVIKHTEACKRVSDITIKAKEVWGGEGRCAFESQYNILISRIDDMVEMLAEAFDALVESEAEFLELDDGMMKELEKSIAEMKG